MVGKARKQVLVTAANDTLSRRISELLRQNDIDVHRSRWDETTTDLVQSTPFDVIVMGFPVDESAMSRFLATARADGAACRRAGLVLVTESDQASEASRLIGKGANRIVTTDRLALELLSAIEDLARPAPRLSVRVPAQIKLYSDGRPLRVMAQIENLSTSGMLLRGVTQFPVGTMFDFEISIPGGAAPISGSAEVTRATDPRHESVRGIGVRFVSLTGSDRTRLETYVANRLETR